MATTPRSRPFTPVPRGHFERPCCGACKTPYNCGNSGCGCHSYENSISTRQTIARTAADLAADPTIPTRRGVIGFLR